MDDVKISAFEKLIIETCNKIPISNRVKYYVLKDIAEKLLQASNTDIAIQTSLIPREEQQDNEEH